MARRIIQQNSFTAGEISPRLLARTETAEFNKGLQIATNAIVLPHGPIKRRNGTQYIAEVKDSSSEVRLIKYQFSKDIAYILEFGDTYIRFYRNNGQIIETDVTITGITQADPGVVTATAHGFSNGDQVYITEVVGMTEVNNTNKPYIVANVNANDFELTDIDGTDVDTTGFTAYVSGGVANRIFTVTSPWDAAEVQNLQVVQSGSTLYIAHPDFDPRTLVRIADTDWTLSTTTFLPPPTFEEGFAPDTTVTPSATTGIDIDFTAGTATFLEGDIGRQIVNLSDDEIGRASIVSVTSTTVAVCDIVEDFTNTDAIASGDWKMDLSPVVDLEVDSIQAGAIVNIRSEHPSGTLGDRLTITAVTSADPGVVTSASHGLSNGEKVQIQDIVGMTQINDREFTIDNVATNTFELKGENTTGFTTYVSGGIARQVLTGIAVDAFRSEDIDKYILINGGVAQIITVTAADDVDAEILKSFNTDDTTGNWTLEVPTWDATRGFPRSVGLFQQRLIYGGTEAQPQNVWMSEIGIFDGFGAGPDDEDSIDIELVSNQVNEINWIIGARDLVVGTSGGEITLDSGASSALGPSTIQQRPRTYHGSDSQQVANVRDEILFIQNSARKIRTFRYDFNIDGYTGEDLNFLAEHITEGGIEELAYAQEPDTIIYAVTTNGDLLAGTYDRAKQIIAWTKTETDGEYEHVQTVSKDEEDQVWVVVKRTVNSITRRYIELLTQGDGTDDLHGFSDSFLTLSDNKTITGITNANPAVITATAHGFANGDKVIIKDLVDPLESDLDSDLLNMSSLNGCTFTVANQTANTFELSGIDTSTSLFNVYGSAGNVWLKVLSISGLDHLEGKTVQVKIDGATHANEVVSSSSITLERSGGEVVVGLPYTTTIKTVDLEFDTGLGSSQGQRARWARPLLLVYRSSIPTLNGEFIPARSGDDLMDKKVPLFSGFLEYGNLKWDSGTALTISISDPFPLQLSGVTGTTNSGVK